MGRFLGAGVAALAIVFVGHAEAAHAQTSVAPRCDTRQDEAAGIVRFCVEAARPSTPASLFSTWMSFFGERLHEYDRLVEDLRDRAEERQPDDWAPMCWALRNGPDIPHAIATSAQAGIADFASCFQGALRSVWDQSIGLVVNTCVWVASRTFNPELIASDAAAAWDVFNDLVATFYAAFYNADALISTTARSCERAATSLSSASPIERARANAAFCSAATDVVGAMAGTFATRARAGIGSAARAELREAFRARVIENATRTSMAPGVVRATRLFSSAGMTSRIYMVERGGEEFLVKVPITPSRLDEQARRFLPERYGGYPDCSLGITEVDLSEVGGRPGELVRGVLMRKIEGVSLADRRALVILTPEHRVALQGHLDRLRADGVMIDDLHSGNVIIAPGGRVYLIDQAPTRAIRPADYDDLVADLWLEFDELATQVWGGRR